MSMEDEEEGSKMKVILSLCLVGLVLAGALTGCARVSTYTTERTDQALDVGNRGFIAGTAPRAPVEKRKLTRTMIKLEFMLPPFPEWRRHYWTDKELWGNRGYITGGPPKKVVARPPRPPKPVKEEELVIMEEPIELPPKKPKLPTTHTVVKGECLWYIAGYPEVYGNPLEWPRIYEANRDIIKNPDLIYPGQVLRIPREDEEVAPRPKRRPPKKRWVK